MDASISNLQFLSELYLDNNTDLSSKEPSSWMNLTSLAVVNLSSCGFYGEFPSNFFLQPNLKVIDLQKNPLVSVDLPESPQVAAIQHLHLSHSNFSVPIPASLAKLTHLTELDFSWNSFNGQIPSSFKGNVGLCGLPLSKKCGMIDGAMPPALLVQQQGDSMFPLDWKFVLAVYCSGFVTGVVIGQELFCRNNRLFNFSSGMLLLRQPHRRIQGRRNHLHHRAHQEFEQNELPLLGSLLVKGHSYLFLKCNMLLPRVGRKVQGFSQNNEIWVVSGLSLSLKFFKC
ncbi:hypothetical protein NE237_018046 [Protea cynaroides]|uniref:Uncharacterized protein n=1 Tax=Protea cynaroides TaxID=273540 RepID=A0A9Q0K974_9MAGN|nr:hypothetical protein NE237_018046 [Protea cynaroides]